MATRGQQSSQVGALGVREVGLVTPKDLSEAPNALPIQGDEAAAALRKVCRGPAQRAIVDVTDVVGADPHSDQVDARIRDQALRQIHGHGRHPAVDPIR